jgi:hypothetical protein
MALTLIQLMKWNGNQITEHNRKPLSIDFDPIQRDARMANGRLRRYTVAKKRKFSTSWDMIPKGVTFAVDGKWSGDAMLAFYLANPGSFTLTITNIDATVETYQVMFSDFSRSIEKRGAQDFWNISVSMDEV